MLNSTQSASAADGPPNMDGVADSAALRACAGGGSSADIALCTVVGIEGAFSRRVGAQLAVSAEAPVAGTLADGCLENQLVKEARQARDEGRPRLLRFGRGSPVIDFRLPCGAGIDVLVDPAPDRAACCLAVDALTARRPASLALPLPKDAPSRLLRTRPYAPGLRLLVFGEGPEMACVGQLARAAGLIVDEFGKQGSGAEGLALGGRPEGAAVDAWSAILLLFHDHEWEQAILHWALEGPAFYIGAQGGRAARESRLAQLAGSGWGPEHLSRIRSPIGMIPSAREPAILAVSALAAIMAEYERVVAR